MAGLTVESSRRGRIASDLAWLVDLLWGPAAEAGVARVSANGTVPEGHVVAERFAVVPRLSRPRFLVPLASRRAAWASTSRYNALRPAGVRALRAAVGAGMRVGVAQWALRDRLVLSVPAGTAAARLEELLVGHHLRGLLGVPDLAMAVGVRAPHPNRKPTLQLLDSAGRMMAYAKLGWSPLTRELVRNEAETLRACAATPPPGLGVPELLAAGRWRDLDLVVTSPLPTGVRRHRDALHPPPVEVTAALAATAGMRTLPLAASPWWSTVRSRVAETARIADGSQVAEVLKAAADRIEERHGAAAVTFGRWHGDWVPWNLAWDRGRLFAWDWEHSGADAPLGFDLLHWHFQVAFIQRGRDVGEAAARCGRLAAPDLARLGIPPTAAAALPPLYLLETYLRACHMRAAGAGWNPRFHPEMLRVLEASAGKD